MSDIRVTPRNIASKVIFALKKHFRYLNIYATPRNITHTSDCYFYHTMDLPIIGTINGNWDIREDMGHYLGNVDLKEKRVLDIGAASGSLSFYMENQGAEVVSYDLKSGADWDLVPYAKWEQYYQCLDDREITIEKLKNSYWYAHRLNQSKAKAVYGNVYQIPKEIGLVDITLYGCILLHLKNPFDALQSGLRLTRETAIITDQVRPYLNSIMPTQVFMPDAKEFKIFDVWWYLNPEIIVKMLEVLGFEDTKVSYHQALFNGQKESLYTVVGHRTSDLKFDDFTSH